MELSAHINNVRLTINIINAKFPNGKIFRSTELYLPMLPSTTRQAHIFPNIKHSPVAIGALCDELCIVTFIIKGVTVMYKNNIILRGWRNYQNKLWCFPIAIENEYEQVKD